MFGHLGQQSSHLPTLLGRQTFHVLVLWHVPLEKPFQMLDDYTLSFKYLPLFPI